MNLGQAVKMAWKSIWGKKGRSALTILGIFIGIAAVMTIVSVMDGYSRAMMAQYASMGTGTLNVEVGSWMYDEEGNPITPAPTEKEGNPQQENASAATEQSGENL